jgi:hypothetical protein
MEIKVTDTLALRSRHTGIKAQTYRDYGADTLGLRSRHMGIKVTDTLALRSRYMGIMEQMGGRPK